MDLKYYLKKIFNTGAGIHNHHEQFEKSSFSQCGEDIIIEYLFRLRNIDKPCFIDIGAYHPIASNNTYKFFLKGSQGVNIDANPASIEKFIAVRPSDHNLNIGIGVDAGEFDFFIMEDESLNTFSATEKGNLERLGNKVKKVIKVKVVSINQVLEQYFKNRPVDLMSVDAEGADFDIIKSFDFAAWLPKVICIETINYTPDGTGSKRYELCEFIEQAGYFEYANTNINSIYVSKKWWFTNN